MKLARFLLVLLTLSFLANCASARFEKDWKTAVAGFESETTDPVSGPWTGKWTTETNGHTGDLRCLVSPAKASDDAYQFRYHATWSKIFKGGYTTEYDVKKSGSGYTVKGSKDLGIFGDFSHDGKIKGDTFNAQYESSTGDKGGFFMKRPQ